MSIEQTYLAKLHQRRVNRRQTEEQQERLLKEVSSFVFQGSVDGVPPKSAEKLLVAKAKRPPVSILSIGVTIENHIFRWQTVFPDAAWLGVNADQPECGNPGDGIARITFEEYGSADSVLGMQTFDMIIVDAAYLGKTAADTVFTEVYHRIHPEGIFFVDNLSTEAQIEAMIDARTPGWITHIVRIFGKPDKTLQSASMLLRKL